MSNSYRRHLSQDQQLVMVEFLEKHPDLVSGRAKVNGKMLWHVLAKKLNVIEGGVRRPSRLWAKTWFDKKSTLKRLVLKQNLERKRGLPVSHVKWTSLDIRIIKLLLQTGDLKANEIALDQIEKKLGPIFTKTERSDDDLESIPSHASSPTLPDGDNTAETFEDIEYLDTADCAQKYLEVKLTKKITNHRRDSDDNHRRDNDANHRRDSEADPLQAEWSRVASMEEQRIQIERKSCKARQDTSDALQRCAIAMESLAGAVNYQSTVISEALTAQGNAIAEALRAQGKMIAEALAKR